MIVFHLMAHFSCFKANSKYFISKNLHLKSDFLLILTEEIKFKKKQDKNLQRIIMMFPHQILFQLIFVCQNLTNQTLFKLNNCKY